MWRREKLYKDRRLTQLYPDLDRLYDETFTGETHSGGADRQIEYIRRLIPLEQGRVVVLGCGPQPHMIRSLVEQGFDAVGVEPVPSFVTSAGHFLQAPERVMPGAAEAIPLPDASVQLVYTNSVLEHVDSPLASLREMARVLKPGGAAMVITTNRRRVSLSGHNGEYRVPFFNWLPGLVRECYAFQHLHYDPRLAYYTDRPAVHWFTFEGLCELGRDAGFARFYSPFDVLEPDDPPLKRNLLARWLVGYGQSNPWVRALILGATYFGGIVIMAKRNDPVVAYERNNLRDRARASG